MARTHVVMSDEVIDEIDRRVGQRGRSRFLEQAAKEKLARLELEEALDATKGIATGERYRHWRDAASSSAWVRRGRKSKRAS